MQIVTLTTLTRDTSTCLDLATQGTPLLIVRFRVRLAWLLPPEIEIPAHDAAPINATQLTRATRDSVLAAAEGQVLEIIRYHKVIARLVPYRHYRH